MYLKEFHRHSLEPYTFVVTGGAGFIGSNIVEYLLLHKAGKVIVIDNLSTGSAENINIFGDDPRLEFHRADITNFEEIAELFRNVDYVLHQAALGSVPRSVENPLATNATNVDGFLNVLWAAYRAGVKRVVYASSSSVYGDDPHFPKSEPQVGYPLSPYAVSKRVNELYAKVFAGTYQLEIVGLRYFNIFGPRQNPAGPYAAVIPLMLESLLQKKPMNIYGDGEQSRDFTFVENAVQANIKAVFAEKEKCNGKVFNIACGESFSLNELISKLEAETSGKIQVTHMPPRKGEIKKSLADVSLAREVLGYQPTVGLSDGLRLTWNWFVKNYS